MTIAVDLGRKATKQNKQTKLRIYDIYIYHNVFCIYVFVYVYAYYMFYGGLAIVATVLPTENDSDIIFVLTIVK